MIKSFAHILLVIAGLAIFLPQTGRAESSRLDENEVKAAYLYNFAKFVDWPSDALPRENSSLVICIVGKSPLNEVIESLGGKTTKNHRLTIRQFSRNEDLKECNILFINSKIKISLPQLLASSAPRSILTVSDGRGFAAAGGIIEFVPVDDKIRFRINNRAALQANLHISSHLLRLATSVIE